MSDPDNSAKNNNLCSFCLQALTIDDAEAGGTLRTDSSGNSTSLDFSGFSVDPWSPNFGQNHWYTYWKGKQAPAGKIDDQGWEHVYSPWGEYYQRRCIARMSPERGLKPPDLHELPNSCRFCCTLRTLLEERYGDADWWQEGGKATLRCQIRYEWRGRRSQMEESEEPEYELECLSILVHHPEQPEDDIDVFKFTVATWPGQCRDWLRITRAPLDKKGPVSEGNINLMKSWIDDCVNNHDACRTAMEKQSVFVPTRLLYLCPDDDERLFLVDDTKSLLDSASATKPAYAALSYCWGASVPLTTTSTTLADRRQEILVATLPRVFQEAVFVARQLGIRYLWIDALCIVQDSREDWERESVKMSDIFSHSYVTICAASSTACDETFLRREEKLTISVPFGSSLKPDVSGNYEIFLDPQRVSEEDIDYRDSKWVNRAWVWQEKEMAARSLIFGSKMLQMRCREQIRLEDGYLWSRGFRPEDVSHYDSFWNSGIGEYSGTQLTYSRDRLSAVAGVARFISRALDKAGKPTPYLAGLWLNDGFSQQLCWAVDEAKQSYAEMMAELTDVGTYRAPSWSWASRNQGIGFQGVLGFSDVFEVVRWDLPAAGYDAANAVKPGSSITLRGKLYPDPLQPPPEAFLGSPGEQDELRHDKWGDPIEDFGRIYYEYDWILSTDDAVEADIRKRFELFVACERRWKRIFGLILLRVEDAPERVYRRVGIFSSQGNYIWLEDIPDSEIVLL